MKDDCWYNGTDYLNYSYRSGSDWQYITGCWWGAGSGQLKCPRGKGGELGEMWKQNWISSTTKVCLIRPAATTNLAEAAYKQSTQTAANQWNMTTLLRPKKFPCLQLQSCTKAGTEKEFFLFHDIPCSITQQLIKSNWLNDNVKILQHYRLDGNRNRWDQRLWSYSTLYKSFIIIISFVSVNKKRHRYF